MLNRLLLTALTIGAPLILLAGGPPPPAPSAIPVTGGVALLVGAAAVYGAKRLRESRNK